MRTEIKVLTLPPSYKFISENKVYYNKFLLGPKDGEGKIHWITWNKNFASQRVEKA